MNQRTSQLTQLKTVLLLFAVVFTTPSIQASRQKGESNRTNYTKEWNFLVYMCNNNNLNPEGMQNFRQMTSVGSTQLMNILLQMDHFGAKEITRLYIEKDNPVTVETQSNTSTSFSGTSANLIDFAHWATSNYPAKRNCLVLWNHGAGIKDPHIWGRVLSKWRHNLFVLNAKTGLLEIDRTLSQNKKFLQDRGIAFNDAAESYLTNEDLKDSLEKINTEMLQGKKFDILAMDACYMAMIEVASQVKNTAKFMVASEEVEPGSGYNYQTILKDLVAKTFEPKEFACHIVNNYDKEYRGTMADYTQSAINLAFTNQFEEAISNLASRLCDLLAKGNKATIQVVKDLRFDHMLVTEFFDPDYIDLVQFLENLASKALYYSNVAQKWSLFSSSTQKINVPGIWKEINEYAVACLAILEKMIIANVHGKKLPHVRGLSLYFPVTSVHSSYYKTEFSKNTGWAIFLEKFIQAKRADDRALAKTEIFRTFRAPCKACNKAKTHHKK